MADDMPLPVAFHFAVSLDGQGLTLPDAAFREVGGLEAEITTEEVREGGENTFVHRLPTGRRQPTLSLVRGLALGNDPLVQWCKSVLEGGFTTEIDTATVTVKLLDADHSPVAAWSAQNCWPVKWKIGRFDAMKNELAMETVELSCTIIRRVS